MISFKETDLDVGSEAPRTYTCRVNRAFHGPGIMAILDVSMGRVMNAVFELLVVRRRKGRKQLIQVGREVMRVVRSAPHEGGGVRTARPGKTSQC